MKATKMFMLLQAMFWADSCSANEITDENKSTLMSRLVKKVQSRSINDTESGRSLGPACGGCPGGPVPCPCCPCGGPPCGGGPGPPCGGGCVCPTGAPTTGAPTTGAPTTGAPTGAPTGTPTQAYDFRIQRAKGRSCKLGYAVPTEEECKEVAASYGLVYKRSFYSKDRPQGCWVKNKSVYFNIIKGMRSHQKVWGKSKAICINEFGTWRPTFAYKMAGMGRNCLKDNMIKDEDTCKKACAEMGVGYKKKVNSKWRPGGCMARKSRCYFNSAFVSPLTKFRNRQGICTN